MSSAQIYQTSTDCVGSAYEKKHLSHKYQVKDEWIVCNFDHFVF